MKLRVLYWNVSSNWRDKVIQRKIIRMVRKFDVVIISEPWIRAAEVGLVQLSGYSLYASLHPETNPAAAAYGGLLTYVADSVAHLTRIRRLNHPSWLDKIVFECSDVTFVASYIPPINSHVLRELEMDPMDSLEADIAGRVTPWVCVIGDLNSHLGFSPDDDRLDSRGIQLLDIAANQSLSLCNGSTEGNGEYTFLRGQSVSVLDVAFVSNNYPFPYEFFLLPLQAESDHRPIGLHLPLVGAPLVKDSLPYKIPPSLDVVISEKVKALNDALVELKKAKDPPPDEPVPCDTEKDAPVTFNVPVYGLSASAIRRRMDVLAREPGFSGNAEAKSVYSDLRKALVKARRRARRSAEQEFHNDLMKVKGRKQYWRSLRKVYKAGKTSIPIHSTAIASHFENLLSKEMVFPEFCDDYREEMRLTLQYSPPGPLVPCLNDPITSEEISYEITQMAESANGEDDLTVAHLRNIPSADIESLFLDILASQDVPTSWTQSYIQPIPKPGKPPVDPGSLRGIVLLPRLRRLYTAIVARRLYSWAVESEVLPSTQIGFRPTYRTTDNLLIFRALLERTVRGSRRRKVLYAVFADLAKAFDLVDRDILWGQLKTWGADGGHVEIVKQLYSQAVSAVRIDGKFSSFFSTVQGVLQGDPLSPLLFILYIAPLDLSDAADPVLDSCTIPLLLLADDLSFFSLTCDGLQRKCSRLEEFGAMWRLVISTAKTVTMAFGPIDLIEPSYTVMLQNSAVARVFSYKLNGYMLECMPNGFWRFHAHLDNKLSKARAQCGSLMTLRKHLGSLPPTYYYGLFKAIVEPHFIYAAEVSTGMLKSYEKRMCDVQIRFGRFCLGLPKNSNRQLILCDLGQFPISWKLRYLKLRFLCYVFMSFEEDRPVRWAVKDSIRLAAERSCGWFYDLVKELGSDAFLLHECLFLDADGDVKVVESLMKTLVDRYQTILREKFAKELSLSLAKPRYDMLRLIPPKISKHHMAMARALYTTLPIHLSIPMARFRHSSHRLRVETGRWDNLAREDRVCSCENGDEVETEWHAVVMCPLRDDLRAWFMERWVSGAGFSEFALFRAVVSPDKKNLWLSSLFVKKLMNRADKRWEER